ncbi:fatty acid-binding protein DegV [Bacillus safensis]|uniref:DegV family protein n=1 Tax=Bacillus TaxID=1386 RepID=UPI00094BD88E|nr:DegV family protein [Bacillus safensis]APT49920.1 fatty acid-binding protein DegV [Bacillus safensis]APT53805.1 fatty acid-binding protein DegV [Bacillus safensis]MBW0258634.1 fatty acid-binding protein DegV [Bacillus sp. F2HM]
MKQIKIVTDSTVDLPQEKINDLSIHVIPLNISISGVDYIDRVNIQPDEFIEKMEAAEELPKTSQPAIGQFVELYEKLTADGSEVISIHLTGGMSGTVQTAESASKMVDGNITVIDSNFISYGLGFQVIKAAELAKKGASREEIITELDKIRHQTKLYVTIDTLENLVKGGRIGRGKALIGSLLHIKPIASLTDGVYTPEANVRSYSALVRHLTKQYVQAVKGKTVQAIGIAHADALELAEKLKKALLDHTPEALIDIAYTTPIISCHTGKGAIGFTFYTD